MSKKIIKNSSYLSAFKRLASNRASSPLIFGIAKKMGGLGSETAFAVGTEAAEWKKTHPGKKLYAFNVGDVDLLPSKAFIEGTQAAGNTYTPPAGLLELRKILAQKLGEERSMPFNSSEISIQPGGKPGLWKCLTTLINPEDKVLTPEPGYPIYDSAVNFHKGIPLHYHYKIDAPRRGPNLHYCLPKEEIATPKLDVDALIAQIKEEKPKVLVLNNDSNPGGVSLSDDELKAIATACRDNKVFVISDEAYFNIRYTDAPGKSIAKHYPEGTAVVWTYSKEGFATGHRIGAVASQAQLINKNKEYTPFIDKINQWNNNIESCTSRPAQEGLLNALEHPVEEAAHLKENLRVIRERMELAHEKLNGMGLTCHLPEAGFYLYANAQQVMEKTGFETVEEFRSAALQNSGVSFCSQVHFGVAADAEGDAYIRFALSAINKDDIEAGLGELSDWIQKKATEVK